MSDSRPAKEWIVLEILSQLELIDLLSDFCIDHGSNGVVLDEKRSNAIKITAYFPAEQWAAVRAALEDLLAVLAEKFPSLPLPRTNVSTLKNENWAIAWKDHFHVMKIGRGITVTPPWLKPDPEGRLVIVIDPAEAFGTGTHETTQGCLILLEDAVDEIKKHASSFSFLDIGCGSGILAIAAVKLGSDRALAVDSDPVAAEAARKNGVINLVDDRLVVECLSVRDLSIQADIVTANLDPQTLLANRGTLLRLFRRFLIVSGVPADQWDQVKGVFPTGEVTLVKEIVKSEWGCGMFGKATAV